MAFIEKKNILYVGGLDDAVTEEMLHSAFLPFGELKSIQLPRDFSSSKTKGYGFVEFENEEDAADAIENMDGSELLGKVLRCNVAKAVSKLVPGKAVWSSDEWAQKEMAEADEDDEKISDLKLIPERNPHLVDDDEDNRAEDMD